MWEGQAKSSIKKKRACLGGSRPLGAKLTRQSLGSLSAASVPQRRKAVEAKRTGSQDGVGAGRKFNSQKCVCFAGGCLLGMTDGSWNPATL